jgi:polysaccharide biosynthesis/export protein
MITISDQPLHESGFLHRIVVLSIVKFPIMFKMINPMRTGSKLVVAIFICIIFVAITGQQSWAQISGGSATTGLDPTNTNPLLLLQQRLSAGSMSAAGIPLEGAVDPSIYIVGPGDSFSISVSGQVATATPVSVGIDGRIVLPDAGAVPVAGLTLEKAREDMLAALRTSFAMAVVDVALVQTRQFYVHVSGAVPRPGRYLALPVARVSSVLEFALADTASVSYSEFRPSLRNIELVHRDGSISAVDLVRYYAIGDRDANPYLTDGDVINVPAYDPNYGSVSVGGYVPFPGRYDFKTGDRLSDLIRIAGGIPDSPNVREIRVSRAANGVLQTFSFSPEESIGSKGGDFELQALDVVSVSQTDESHGLVSVEGRVEYPGTYPIVSGKTTLKELILAAGGPKSDALFRGAYIERSARSSSSIPANVDRYQAQADVYQRMLSSDSSSYKQQLRLTDLGFLSRAYFAFESGLQNRVSVNLMNALADEAKPVYLEADDRIIIPKDVKSVYVLGQVNQPGYLPVQPGMSAEYYIAAAGGRSTSADRIFIVNPATGSYSEMAAGLVYSGDVIFVDRLKPVADNAELQRLVIEESRIKIDARFQTVQTALQSVATLASLIVLIVSLRR